MLFAPANLSDQKAKIIVEIIIINDGSKDDTQIVIDNLIRNNDNVKSKVVTSLSWVVVLT